MKSDPTSPSEQNRWHRWEELHDWRAKYRRRRSPIIILGLLILVLVLMWRFAHYGM